MKFNGYPWVYVDFKPIINLNFAISTLIQESVAQLTVRLCREIVSWSEENNYELRDVKSSAFVTYAGLKSADAMRAMPPDIFRDVLNCCRATSSSDERLEEAILNDVVSKIFRTF